MLLDELPFLFDWLKLCYTLPKYILAELTAWHASFSLPLSELMTAILWKHLAMVKLISDLRSVIISCISLSTLIKIPYFSSEVMSKS
jgi:hypothetical protein